MKQLVSKFGVLVLLLAPGVGCSPSVRMPRLYNPGPAGYQRYNAETYSDPYPMPDLGPEVVGGRPREFQVPRPQVERARQFTYQQSQPKFVAPAPAPTYAPQPTYGPQQ